MRNNITYLIGAGASYYSMPLVKTMNDRMYYFLYLMDPSNGTSDISVLKNQTKKVYDLLIETMNEASKHKTIDTYAKKLWLTNRNEDLHKLKVLLDLYFTFEQDVTKNLYKDLTLFKEDEKNGYWPSIGKLKDYRYDVFFATLLDKNLKLPTNIKIISWNYDYQIEIAYVEYLGNNNPKLIAENLRIYPPKLEDDPKEEYSILKLNGQVNLCLDSEKKIDDLMEKIHFVRNNNISDYQTSISFAWESNDNQENRIKYAEEIFSQTNELVVIGYSFPSFNRTIDGRLFSKLNELDKIKIQCPKEDYNSISTSIADMPYWESNEHFNSVVELHNDVGQFYIPSFQLL
jgi:hypothetical protein